MGIYVGVPHRSGGIVVWLPPPPHFATPGTCTNPATIDGVPCNDGNSKTENDACQAGVCVGVGPYLCGLTQQTLASLYM